jgi:hypothetical protein
MKLAISFPNAAAPQNVEIYLFSAPRLLPHHLNFRTQSSLLSVSLVSRPIATLSVAASLVRLPADMSSSPKYLTDDKEGIRAFLAEFDVRQTCRT